MKPLSILQFPFLLLLQSILTHAVEYKGCDIGKFGRYIENPPRQLPCDRRGGIYNGVALMPEFPVQDTPRLKAIDACNVACWDRLACKSWSFHEKKKTCQLYLKTIYEQGFEPQKDSPRVCYNRSCTYGSRLKCSNDSQAILVQDHFETPGRTIFSFRPESEGVHGFTGPDRCAGSSSTTLYARAKLNSKISMFKKFKLSKVGANLLLTYDYLYEELDDTNIILGFMYQTDKRGGLSNIFEMARADDKDMIGIWQRKSIRLETVRTKGYKIEFNFDHIPGTTPTRAVTWRIDNICLTEL